MSNKSLENIFLIEHRPILKIIVFIYFFVKYFMNAITSFPALYIVLYFISVLIFGREATFDYASSYLKYGIGPLELIFCFLSGIYYGSDEYFDYTD